MGIADALHKAVLLGDQRTDQPGRVDGAAAHGLEIRTAPFQQLIRQCGSVGNDADGAQGIQPKLGTNHNGLGIRIADTADTDIPPHFLHVFFKLCPEGRAFNAVDISLKAKLLGIGGHTAPTRTQMGVIVRAEEHVLDAVIGRCCSEKTAHTPDSPITRLIIS